MKNKIFILEDDEGIRKMLQFLLEDQGYLVKSFSSVRDFWEHLQEEQPDLVVLDLWLPDGSGSSVCRQIRASRHTESLPILIMTANILVNRVEGADDFISKPFDINDLFERISNLLVRRGEREISGR